MSSRSSPEVLAIVTEAQVTRAVNSSPSFMTEQGISPVIRVLFNWIHDLVSILWLYVSGQLDSTSDRIVALEATVADLQARPIPSQPATTTPRQPQRPSKPTRCQRCHAMGHAVNDCHTQDPAAQKKRVAATQKAAKEMERRRMAAILPRRSLANSTFPVHLEDFFGDTVIRAPTSGGVVIPSLPDRTTTRSQARSLMGLAADATELRRRRIQSTRDKRRRNASSANAPDNP
jgi:hypothetical protein